MACFPSVLRNNDQFTLTVCCAIDTSQWQKRIADKQTTIYLLIMRL